MQTFIGRVLACFMIAGSFVNVKGQAAGVQRVLMVRQSLWWPTTTSCRAERQSKAQSSGTSQPELMRPRVSGYGIFPSAAVDEGNGKFVLNISATIIHFPSGCRFQMVDRALHAPQQRDDR